MQQQRRRVKQVKSLEERLADEAKGLREEARLLPPGAVREQVLRKARQAETACHMSEWLRAPGTAAQGKPSAREYRVFVLTAEGHVVDQHTLTCADEDEAKETAKVLAESNPIEIWDGPVRIARFIPKH